MAEVLLNGELRLSCPEGFEQMDTLELARDSFTDRTPFFSVRNPERHISVTAAWKKPGWFAYHLTSALAAAKKSETNFSRAMTGRSYRGEGASPARLGGRDAAVYRCRYTQGGVEMTGVSVVSRFGGRIYYLHGYFQSAREAEALPLWEALLGSAAWAE